MKIRKNHVKTVALAALGVVLGRGAQAETVLNFDALPPGQTHNTALIQSFGDYASASSEGVTVNGFGTPNIGLTWQGTGGRWDYYINSVWASGQLDSCNPGDRHEVVFTPNNPGVQVVIKSFNFFPYYVDAAERFTFDVSVLSGSTVVSGPTSLTFTADGLPDHPVSLNYTGAAGATLTLRIARTASTLAVGEQEGGGGNIAVDDITFAQVPEQYLFVAPSLVSISPSTNSAGVSAQPTFRAVLTNGTSTVASSSIGLRLNGSDVQATTTQDGGLTTVTYQYTGILPSLSTNKFTLTYKDDSVPAKSYTNETQFVVTEWVNKVLPAPFAFESFDNTPEGNLPPGWTSVSYNDVSLSDQSINFVNLDSAAYTNWTVIDSSRFTGTFETYSEGAATPPADAADYQRVLSPGPANIVNGAFVRNLATNKFVFASSGYRSDPLGQILYLFSPDFNLTGRSNVYLSFNSIYEQNQDSIGAVEYSVDKGATWLPIVYMLVDSDVLTNASGAIDPVLTFSTMYTSDNYQNVARWVDSGSITQGGFYGAFIGVASNQWSTLAPYISKRVDDDQYGSKRVELFRLGQADNKATVRFRFAYAGTDSWYFGVDNFGLYSIAPASTKIKSVTKSDSDVVITWDGATGTKLQQTTSLKTPNWQDVAGTDGASSATVPATGTESYFRLKTN